MDSIWRMGSGQGEFPALKGSVESDVCIVGAGIAGLLMAYRLSELGRKVVVVDRGQPGGLLNTSSGPMDDGT